MLANKRPLRPLWAEINLTAIQENIKQVKALVGPRVKVMAVV